jgi:hypothetical protein
MLEALDYIHRLRESLSTVMAGRAKATNTRAPIKRPEGRRQPLTIAEANAVSRFLSRGGEHQISVDA